MLSEDNSPLDGDLLDALLDDVLIDSASDRSDILFISFERNDRDDGDLFDRDDALDIASESDNLLIIAELSSLE